jgi:hypothetical protein
MLPKKQHKSKVLFINYFVFGWLDYLFLDGKAYKYGVKKSEKKVFFLRF